MISDFPYNADYAEDWLEDYRWEEVMSSNIKESLKFDRGKDPKRSMEIGAEDYVFINEVISRLTKILDSYHITNELKWENLKEGLKVKDAIWFNVLLNPKKRINFFRIVSDIKDVGYVTFISEFQNESGSETVTVDANITEDIEQAFTNFSNLISVHRNP